ncbi:CvpA family protein [Castellaniella sp. GW247-6E4]|uniref:CvpA family protein n=1 Tax=Castellaniella sp. GW247-6E4 TaxID=3140380 RepID=UPI0033157CD5
MTSFDYIAIAVLVLSALIGLMRGFVREILSLIAYVVAFISSIWWGPGLSGWLVQYIENGLLRTIAAYGAMFLIALMLIGLLNIALGALLDRTGLTPADHGLGAVFGTVRGLLIVLALVGLAGYTELPREPWWQEARTSAAAVRGFQQIKSLLPPSLAQWLPY